MTTAGFAEQNDGFCECKAVLRVLQVFGYLPESAGQTVPLLFPLLASASASLLLPANQTQTLVASIGLAAQSVHSTNCCYSC